MITNRAPFDVRIGKLISTGVRGYLANALPLSLAGAATLATYLSFRLPAQSLFRANSIALSIAMDLAGLVIAGVVAIPWYSYAMDAAQGRPAEIAAPLRRASFSAQAVASFWFWAAVLFGLRYLWGIPSVVALVFYAFHGFIVASGGSKSGLKALGMSAAIGEGRRFGLFGVAVVIAMFNLLATLPLGLGLSPATLVATGLAMTVTASISLVAGAHLYHVLTETK